MNLLHFHKCSALLRGEFLQHHDSPCRYGAHLFTVADDPLCAESGQKNHSCFLPVVLKICPYEDVGETSILGKASARHPLWLIHGNAFSRKSGVSHDGFPAPPITFSKEDSCMKKGILFLVLSIVFMLCAAPCQAQDKMYRIEALQVTDIEPYKLCYDKFIDELGRNGLVQGKNLEINRTVIDFDVEKAGLWKKISVLMRIKSEASRIVDARPDLVLTIGTPATKHAKDKIIDAGIPVVFAAVSIPEAAGCKSLTESGPGFTGSTLYMNMETAMKIIKLAFPNLKKLAVVYSDDENAVAHVKEASKHAPSVGMEVISRQVKSKSDHITPYALELLEEGADTFIIPLDTYYGLRDYEVCKELLKLGDEYNQPGISLVLMKFPGACLYVGADFGVSGSMSAQQALKIIIDGVKPETLPLAHQQDLNVMVDTKMMAKRGVELPFEILQIARPVE
jgi:putative ABC transport system substrate-binding protein